MGVDPPTVMPVRRSLIVLGLVVAGCATAASPPSTTSMPSITTVPISPVTTSAVSTSTTEDPTPAVLAPDFTLVLGDGGSFTLSESDKPVYLLFWAEWCPTCRKEIPMIDRLAAEYGDRIDFVAPVWKSAEEHARTAAADLMPSGVIKWGMDIEQVIFGLYGVPFQPVTVLIHRDRTVLESWAGVRSEERIRDSLDRLAPADG